MGQSPPTARWSTKISTLRSRRPGESATAPESVPYTERRRIEHLKNDLLSVASHELRAPTAAMIGTLALLEARAGPVLDDASRQTLELAKEEGSRMLELLESCLDVERLEQEDLCLQVITALFNIINFF